MGLFVSTRELSILALKSGFSSGDEPTLLAPTETQAIREILFRNVCFCPESLHIR